GQLTRPLLDLALEARVRLLELGGHAVELVAERLELVARADVNPLVELARADPRRAGLERLDGRDQSAGQNQARRDRQDDADDEEDDRSLDGGVEGPERVT